MLCAGECIPYQSVDYTSNLLLCVETIPSGRVRHVVRMASVVLVGGQESVTMVMAARMKANWYEFFLSLKNFQ